MFYNLLQDVQTFLSLLLAYGVSVTIAGAVKAWVAKKVGDYTAEHAGFITLDPLVHVDLLGVVSILLVKFGWGRDVPVNVQNVRAPYRDIKILAIYYAQTIVHIFITSLAIFCLAGVMVAQMIDVGSTVTNVILVLQAALLRINIFLAMFRFIESSVDLVCIHFIEESPEATLFIRSGSLAATFILVYFAGEYIANFFYIISAIIAALVMRLFL